ncbi:MAG: NAD(P)H-hydrate epimerase [Candidatus Omnitrophota bacterium]
MKKIKTKIKNSILIVDAIFGIGLNKKISGIYKETINLINDSKVPVVSLDIPSGLSADSGDVFRVCVRAFQTITFGFRKKGFTKQESAKLTGKITVVDISLPQLLK